LDIFNFACGYVIQGLKLAVSKGIFSTPHFISQDLENLLKDFLRVNPVDRITLEVNKI